MLTLPTSPAVGASGLKLKTHIVALISKIVSNFPTTNKYGKKARHRDKTVLLKEIWCIPTLRLAASLFQYSCRQIPW